jgi:hypothetical protein
MSVPTNTRAGFCGLMATALTLRALDADAANPVVIDPKLPKPVLVRTNPSFSVLNMTILVFVESIRDCVGLNLLERVHEGRSAIEAGVQEIIFQRLAAAMECRTPRCHRDGSLPIK